MDSATTNNRRPLIAGNWKMHLDLHGARRLARELAQKVARARHCDLAVAPPFPFLEAVARVLDETSISVAAQDVSPEEEGAFTGDVSARMLLSVGCSHVIVGHSERRQHHLETDELVRRKVERSLQEGLVPILCVGERLEEREAGRTFYRVETQVNAALAGLSEEQVHKVVIAYEPVWAIGTGRTATPAQAQEVHEFIRNLVRGTFGFPVASRMRILYGGSVKPENARSLLDMPDVDGALVGGASLSADSFSKIVFSQQHEV